MCQLLSTLPKVSKNRGSYGGKSVKNNLELFIRPSKEKEYYRIRLLGFVASKKSDRSDAFIERFVHQHWGTDENGKKHIDDVVVCPTTKFVNWEGDRLHSCPICNYASSNFGTWKNSDWKDAISKQNYFANNRQFQGIIPCYVVNDPNYEKNIGSFSCRTYGTERYRMFKKR